MHPIKVRRYSDNSIDYGFYRRRAARLRTKTMRNSVKGMASMIKPRIKPLVAIALLLGAVLAVPTRAPQVPDHATDVVASEASDRRTAN
jgi:heme O synthase-like polyprenyltransferase